MFRVTSYSLLPLLTPTPKGNFSLSYSCSISQNSPSHVNAPRCPLTLYLSQSRHIRSAAGFGTLIYICTVCWMVVNKLAQDAHLPPQIGHGRSQAGSWLMIGRVEPDRPIKTRDFLAFLLVLNFSNLESQCDVVRHRSHHEP